MISAFSYGMKQSDSRLLAEGGIRHEHEHNDTNAT